MMKLMLMTEFSLNFYSLICNFIFSLQHLLSSPTGVKYYFLLSYLPLFHALIMGYYQNSLSLSFFIYNVRIIIISFILQIEYSKYNFLAHRGAIVPLPLSHFHPFIKSSYVSFQIFYFFEIDVSHYLI